VVSDVNVRLRLNHTFDDLDLDLVAPMERSFWRGTAAAATTSAREPTTVRGSNRVRRRFGDPDLLGNVSFAASFQPEQLWRL
jgi:hypothetical protein